MSTVFWRAKYTLPLCNYNTDFTLHATYVREYIYVNLLTVVLLQYHFLDEIISIEFYDFILNRSK